MKKLPIIVLLILTLSGCVAKSKYLAQVAETESTKATFQNEMKKNAALNERISTLNSILSESSTEKGRLRDEIARLEAERDAMKRQVNQISSEIERLNLQLAAATSENGQLKERIEKLLSEVASVTSEINKTMEAAPVAPATEETGLQDEKDRSSSEIDRLNSELDSTRKENGELTRKIDSLSKEVINLTAELERAKTAVVPAPATVQVPPVEGLKSEISRLEKEKAELESELKDFSAEAERAKEEAARKEREIREMKETHESLLGKLKKEVEHKDVKIEMVKEGLSLKIMGRVLFASGSDTISKSGRDLLDRISKVLINIKDRIIKVEGHTDNKPIGPRIIDKFPTNWELSASRATRVVRYLANKGIDPGMISATGLSMYNPVATNDTKEGREQNRRIEIILYPKGSAKVE